MYFDCHTHTENSPDSNCSIEELCTSAIKKGLSAISVTDHADIPEWELFSIPERIEASYKQSKAASKKYAGQIKIFSGIELGEAYMDPALAGNMIKNYDFDIVLGSVHILRDGTGFSDIDFSDYSKQQLEDILEKYYDEMYEMANTCDIDVLTHITYAFRYINGKYKKNIDISRYENKIEKIFKVICSRGIALEINTSGAGTEWNTFMPDSKLLKLYADCGGKLVTLGSDSHIAQNVGKAFDQALLMLSECGFYEYLYFEKRKPVPVPIKYCNK